MNDLEAAQAEVARLTRAMLRERRKTRLFREAVRAAVQDSAGGQVLRDQIDAAARGETGSAEHVAVVAELLAPVWNFSWVIEGTLAGCGLPDTREAVRELGRQGIQAVVSLEAPRVTWLTEAGIDVLLLADLPDMGIPSLAQLQRAVDFATAHISAGRAVAVHCEAGIGRTSIVLAALLVAQGNSVDNALATVKRTRPLPVSDPAALAAIREFAAAINQ